MKEELKKFIDYYNKSKLSKSFDITEEELIDNYLSTEEEFKIGGFWEHDFMTPDKLERVLEVKRKKAIAEMIKNFHAEVNEGNFQKIANKDGAYRFYPSSSLRHDILDNLNEFPIIIEEYKKVGWANVFMSTSSPSFMTIDFYKTI